jgi:hypothetical protein
MFLAAADAARIAEALGVIRLRVRKARRYTTKSASPTGQRANVALHDAERLTDAALALLEGRP